MSRFRHVRNVRLLGDLCILQFDPPQRFDVLVGIAPERGAIHGNKVATRVLEKLNRRVVVST